ncbi:hypothetical protein P9239_18605 [Caballeronia sp. LZ062]|uniref:hypothetical protein n=1 Tax=unclassified Caballeronia TaxID=2646786 RepID=UPI0028645394|nr:MULTISPECIES: hypothetical protein [unclassified Caballeronia]MDR5855854.1 hypothetical protein [Caballeronia sp. LZ050]MDR5872360.1 hypothetical protein [Caballeronia sp. LZ062]
MPELNLESRKTPRPHGLSTCQRKTRNIVSCAAVSLALFGLFCVPVSYGAGHRLLAAPVIAGSLRGSDAVLQWAPVKGAETYDIQWSRDGESWENEARETTTNWSPRKGFVTGAIYFRVRACDGAGCGQWSRPLESEIAYPL